MSLADLVPCKKPQNQSYPIPLDISAENGMRCELHWCDKHRQEYHKIYTPNFDIWTGQCDECKAQQALEQKARELLASRRTRVMQVKPSWAGIQCSITGCGCERR